MEFTALLAVVGILALCGSGGAFPSGASPKACVMLVPGHVNGDDGTPINPEESVSPFSIMAEGSEYSPGGMVEVTINAEPSTAMFQGFLLQARSVVGSSDPVGTFVASLDGTSKLLTCNATGDSITHTAPTAKQGGMSFMWQAPAASVGDIKFLLTVAQDHDIFWVRMESNTLTSSASVAALSMSLLLVLLVGTMTTTQV